MRWAYCPPKSSTAMAARRSPIELVPHAVHGQEELRVGGTRLDLLAQLGDVNVDGARQRRLVVAPDLVEQAVARDHLAAVLDEVPQEAHLARRHLDSLALAAHFALLE